MNESSIGPAVVEEFQTVARELAGPVRTQAIRDLRFFPLLVGFEIWKTK